MIIIVITSIAIIILVIIIIVITIIVMTIIVTTIILITIIVMTRLIWDGGSGVGGERQYGSHPWRPNARNHSSLWWKSSWLWWQSSWWQRGFVAKKNDICDVLSAAHICYLQVVFIFMAQIVSMLIYLYDTCTMAWVQWFYHHLNNWGYEWLIKLSKNMMVYPTKSNKLDNSKADVVIIYSIY